MSNPFCSIGDDYSFFRDQLKTLKYKPVNLTLPDLQPNFTCFVPKVL